MTTKKLSFAYATSNNSVKHNRGRSCWSGEQSGKVVKVIDDTKRREVLAEYQLIDGIPDVFCITQSKWLDEYGIK